MTDVTMIPERDLRAAFDDALEYSPPLVIGYVRGQDARIAELVAERNRLQDVLDLTAEALHLFDQPSVLTVAQWAAKVYAKAYPEDQQ